ncbi:MAG: PAS domain S-box protein [Chitinophagaceae bacterium]|nr:PAS domain S-box protein [Chitinophagaceae bacterium]
MSTAPLSKTPKMQGRIRWLFLFSVIATVAFGTLMYQQQKTQEKTRYWLDHTYFLIKKIGELKTHVAQAESVTRSRFISGDTSWNSEIFRLHQIIRENINLIDTAIRGNVFFPEKDMQQVKKLVAEKEVFQQQIALGLANDNLVRERMSFDGKAPVQSRNIRQILDSMYSEGEKGLLQRTKENEESFFVGNSISIAAGLFAFLVILWLLVQLNRDFRLRKKAEAEVNTSDARYRQIIENTSVVMYTTDINGTITFANQQVSDLTGYTVEELLGKDFSFLVHPSWLQQVFNHYTAQFQQRIPSTVLEFITRTKSGQQKWVEQTAQLILIDDRVNGYQCMVKDITEKKKIELELKESELKRRENQYRLEAILENTTSPIFIKNLDGRYLMVNRRFKELLGVTDEMVINKTDYEFSEKEAADQFKRTDDEVISTRKPVESEVWIYGPEGRKNLLVIKFPLIDHKRKIFGVSGIATDITDRVLYQQKLIEARKNAEESKRMQEQFLANMSHEIRTPMNGIQGMTNLLLQTALDDQQKEFAVMIRRSVNNLLVIVNDILDFSKIKAGRLTIDKTRFQLQEILNHIRLQFDHEIAQKELSLDIQVDSDVPATLIGDPYRLNQVLINIIGNAVKFTVSGQVSLRISLVSRTDTQVSISFQVSDTGIGIPEEKMNTIFDAFTQAGPDIARNYGGAGLGLAICKGLIDLQHGSIEARSKFGEGSIFTFILPYECEIITPENSNKGSDLLRGKRFLVAEDNEVNQKLVSYVLKKVGGEVDIAGNGRAAIELLEEKGNIYDLIIMDIQMPVMDGYEATEYLRQVLKLRTPVIAMTATALKGDQERSVEVGMNDFMLKPFDFDDLYKRLIRLLSADQDSHINSDGDMTQEQLFDLSLLEGLDDRDSLLDVLNLFLENTPLQVQELSGLAASQNWPALFQLAHKLKGALLMLQASRISELLGKIESEAKEGKNTAGIPADVEQVVRLFAIMEQQLIQEKTRITKER